MGRLNKEIKNLPYVFIKSIKYLICLCRGQKKSLQKFFAFFHIPKKNKPKNSKENAQNWIFRYIFLIMNALRLNKTCWNGYLIIFDALYSVFTLEKKIWEDINHHTINHLVIKRFDGYFCKTLIDDISCSGFLFFDWTKQQKKNS